MISLRLLVLDSIPVYEQLQVEEALLRADTRNWCIINVGSPPAIVLGISGKVEELVNTDTLEANPIPLVRRFSGGGTVVVDSDTVFVTFLFNRKEMAVDPFPEKIMRWTEQFYRPVIQSPSFALRENDYVLNSKKFGGNAQYIRKDRWLHHTTFLWDYSPENMRYLRMPRKAPTYRSNRGHNDFLCRLSDLFPSQQIFVDRITDQLENQFGVERVSWDDAATILDADYRRSTRIEEAVPV
ncbi:hypothetical protein SCG7086_BF_00090 [Chlamydiales bacterium SCGC AG-110-P3]|nr:hypothetical protein SCG7086_BF_00090 [Chlamydiales bacterium SCGC AG-110-P3]